MVEVSTSKMLKHPHSRWLAKRLTPSSLVNAILVIFLVLLMACLFWVNLIFSAPDSSSAPIDCISNTTAIAADSKAAIDANSKTAIDANSKNNGVMSDSSTATVMGMATGYSVQVYKRFVGSLRKSGFRGMLQSMLYNLSMFSFLTYVLLHRKHYLDH
jgi:predicted PurR-regulated permease PerM